MQRMEVQVMGAAGLPAAALHLLQCKTEVHAYLIPLRNKPAEQDSWQSTTPLNATQKDASDLLLHYVTAAKFPKA
jgi:hypothetical protein